MFKNYLKTTIRNIQKYKVFSFINVLGFAIGIASCMLILVFVLNELNYDNFHLNAGRIYRTSLKFNIGTNQFDVAMGPCPLAFAMVQDFPEVENAVRIYPGIGRNIYVRYEDDQFREEDFLWADSTIFDIFSIPVIEGDPETALKQPNSVVITEEMAQKYFADESPIGKSLMLEDGTVYEVTGITEKMPVNSHFHFDFLASFQTLEKSRDGEWYDIAVFTYILVKENADTGELSKKLPAFTASYVGPVIESAFGVSYDKFLESGNVFGFFLQPLLGIHLDSAIENEFETPGNIQTVIIFSAIALIILLVACINFINLSTARAVQRANEVGVRKAIGSSKLQLITQFLFESTFLCAASVLFAVFLLEMSLPVFNNLVGKELTAFYLESWLAFPIILGTIFIVGIAAGIYPALLLASYQPVNVLKGKFQSGLKGRRFRNYLVVFQFSTSITLIIGTIVIYNQLHYFQEKNLGFDRENVLVLQNVNVLGTEQRAFKNAVLQNPDITAAAYSDCLPQIFLETKVFQKAGDAGNENHTLITITADHDYINTFKFTMDEGRFFDEKLAGDSAAVILNQSALTALGITDPETEKLTLMGLNPKQKNIIGVVKDFHIEPLHSKIRPMALLMTGNRPGIIFSIRIRADKVEGAIAHIEKQWKKFLPDQPFEYIFLDEDFMNDYQSEIQAGRIFSAFASLAIFIACMGLFGLASFTILRKTKEIGIRKALGASITSIVLILTRDFTKWVLAANIIAWPVAWFAMSKWLETFAYRIDLNIIPFIAAAAIAFGISFITVIYLSIRAALADPVESLRYE